MLIRFLLWTSVPLGMFVSWFSWQLYWQAAPLELARETTLITEPLAEDGLPSYSMFLIGRMKSGVTPQNNGATALVRAMWPAELIGTEKQLVCAELGMEMPTAAGLAMPYSDKALLSALAAWCGSSRQNEFHVPEEDLIEAIEVTPWTSADAPPLAHWIDEHAEHFALLHEAARHEQFYFPSPTLLANPKANLLSMRTPGAETLRTAVKCLALRANLRIGSGDLNGAWDDCRVIYRLADVSTHCTILCEMQAYRREDVANGVLLHLIQSPQITRELADEVAAFLDARQPQHSLHDTLRSGARVDFITDLLEISGYRRSLEPNNKFGPSAPPEEVDHKPAIDWSTVLRIANEEYDQYLAAADQPTYAAQQQSIETWTSRVNELAKEPHWTNLLLEYEVRTNHMAYELVQMIPSRLAATIEHARRNQVDRQLHVTAVALARYRLSAGEYPEALDQLVPACLSRVPMDPFDRPLMYRRTAEGYLLYSLGRDDRDSAGSNNELGLYQGYPEPECDEEVEQLCLQLEKEGGKSTLVDTLRPSSDDDDIAIRAPLMQPQLPKFGNFSETEI